MGPRSVGARRTEAVAMIERWSTRGCLSDGALRALVDAEPLDGDGRAHLAACPHCARRQEDIRRQARQAESKLARLDDVADVDAHGSYVRLWPRLAASR